MRSFPLFEEIVGKLEFVNCVGSLFLITTATWQLKSADFASMFKKHFWR